MTGTENRQGRCRCSCPLSQQAAADCCILYRDVRDLALTRVVDGSPPESGVLGGTNLKGRSHLTASHDPVSEQLPLSKFSAHIQGIC